MMPTVFIKKPRPYTQHQRLYARARSFLAVPPCFDYSLHQKSRSKRDPKLEGNNPHFSSSPFPTNSSAFTGAPVSDLIVAALQGNSLFLVRKVLHQSPYLYCHLVKLLRCFSAFQLVNACILSVGEMIVKFVSLKPY